MQIVYLNGGIAEFGSYWESNCTNIRDIFKLIDCQTPGFRKYMIDAAESGVGFELQRGSEILSDEQELLLTLNEEDIIITEVPVGSKSGGAKILAALAIVALMFTPVGQALLFNPGSASAVSGAATGGAGAGTMAIAGAGGLNTAGLMAASIAVNLAITGISQIMMPGPEVDKGTDDAYLFDGPTNSITQGLPVPVAYGELVVGGAPVSQYYRPASQAISGTSGWIDTFVTGLLYIPPVDQLNNYYTSTENTTEYS